MEDCALSEGPNVSGLAAATGATMAAPTASFSGEDTLALVLASLDDDKGEDIVSIPLRGKTEIADHMVVVSGTSSRQVAAMAEHLIEKLKFALGSAPKVEGLDAGDWVLLDAGDVLVHLFRPEVRAFYEIEKMWLTPEELLARRAAAD
jgi:ribosome-associated protein